MVQLNSGSTPSGDAAEQVIAGVSDQLLRRGYLTTEWWTTIIGGAVSTVLALVHVNASSATHVAAVAAPALLAGLYAVTRTMHKSALAGALAGLFPQAGPSSAAPASTAAATTAAGTTPGPPNGAPTVVTSTTAAPTPAAATPGAASSAVPAGAGAQTDADFVFRGIPPIEDTDG